MSANSAVYVSRTESGYSVRVEGRATLKQSPSLQRFAEACYPCDRCDLWVDLDGCSYIDSTFAGCLITICKRYRSLPSEFKLKASDERRDALLRQLALHKYFPFVDEAPATHGEAVLLAGSDCEGEDFAYHVLQCHRELCDVGGPQQDIFRQLVAQLEREVRTR